MHNMLVDLIGDVPPAADEHLTPSAQAFYKMVASAKQLVHDKLITQIAKTCLPFARLIAIRAQYNISIAYYDDILKPMHDFLPPVSNLTKDFCHSKKMLDGLGMPYVKTDICHNKCMLHWKDDVHKDKCDL
jgi:hypothetical protein